MHHTQPVSASGLAGHVDQLFANSWDSSCHLGLLPPSTDISGVQLTPIFGPAAPTLQSLHTVSAVAACLTVLGQGTTIATSSEAHVGTCDRVRLTIAATADETAIVVRSTSTVRRGTCPIDHPLVSALRDWARLSERTREPG